MTASVNILRGDLHLMMSGAFNRGRYVLMTDGEGRPLEITVDLKERDDDLFGDAGDMVPDRIRTEGGVWVHVNRPADAPPATDDHGPAIPAQTSRIETPFGAVEGVVTKADGSPGPVVYEFALQDTKSGAMGFGLDRIVAPDAPDAAAFHAADWVHVYDRVTRERRTLKRPAPDAILTGLRDVAADLRAR
jgi:hypothetical protein